MKLILITYALTISGTATAVGVLSSDERIIRDGYPVEIHTVVTSDKYVLTLFRIPFSPTLQNQNATKAAVLVQHGFLSSSDIFLLNGPNDALAYNLADAGYDVWLGNVRGNTYSKKNLDIPRISPKFWNFSWNEMGLYDLPAMIDHILSTTGETGLHYVGHSQGTTMFFVLTSTIPRYNDVFKTSHMLAPVAFTEHLQSPVRLLAPILGDPKLFSGPIPFQCFEILPYLEIFSYIESQVCSTIVQPLCANPMFLIAGWDSKHLNYTLVPDIFATHPAGSSICQGSHYLQQLQSGYFRKFDFGERRNQDEYGQSFPPDYALENISTGVRLYYGNNDVFAHVVDVLRLAELLPKVDLLYNIPIDVWTHVDFVFALEVKYLINNVIIEAMDEYEQGARAGIANPELPTK